MGVARLEKSLRDRHAYSAASPRLSAPNAWPRPRSSPRAAPQRGIVEAMPDPTEALADRLFRDAAGALALYTLGTLPAPPN